MVGVGVVALVRDVLHRAIPLPVDLGKTVAQGLGGGAIQGEADVGLSPPAQHRLIQMVHDL